MLTIVCLAFALGSCRERPAGDPAALTIGVIPKGATHEHWKRVRLGAEKAAAEFRAKGVPVQVRWKGPLREDDREQHVQVVEGFVSQRLSGLVLAPLDSHALVRPVEEADDSPDHAAFGAARGSERRAGAGGASSRQHRGAAGGGVGGVRRFSDGLPMDGDGRQVFMIVDGRPAAPDGTTCKARAGKWSAS